MSMKELLVEGQSSNIDGTIPAIQNFGALNQSTKSYSSTVPLRDMEQSFVSFSERELGILFGSTMLQGNSCKHWCWRPMRTRASDLLRLIWLIGFEDRNQDT